MCALYLAEGIAGEIGKTDFLGKVPVLDLQFKQAGLKIVALQETRINDVVDCKFNNFKFYFVGRKGKDIRLNGVGFAVDLEIDSATTEFHQIDNRIAWLGGKW